MKLKIRHLFLGFLATGLVGCAAGNGYGGYGGYYNPKGNSNYNNYQSNQYYTGDEEYNYVPEVTENPFVNVSEESKTSNVSLTSSAFSYSILRQAINRGNMYNAKNSARIEEMLNYFSYGYVNDTDDALVTKLELDACPWNNEHYLASVVVKAKPAITENVKNNIVILVDKSFIHLWIT